MADLAPCASAAGAAADVAALWEPDNRIAEEQRAGIADRDHRTDVCRTGCAQCDDHKYDAISHREYFGLYAIFDQTADRDRADEAPVLSAPTEEQSKSIAAIEGKLARGTLEAVRENLAR